MARSSEKKLADSEVVEGGMEMTRDSQALMPLALSFINWLVCGSEKPDSSD